MEDIIIIVVLAALVVMALMRAGKHFRGGCCGSSGTAVRSKKKLTEPKIGQIVLTVEGMHCENCRNRIEYAVNDLDGVVCKVDLKKKTAAVSFSREVSADALKEIVERMGYKVTNIV